MLLKKSITICNLIVYLIVYLFQINQVGTFEHQSKNKNIKNVCLSVYPLGIFPNIDLTYRRSCPH